jgi:WD repeat-containing protein 89
VLKMRHNGLPFFSGDCNGRAVAAGSEQGEICLWDLRSPKRVLGVLDELHTDEITQLKFHPIHRSMLFSGSVDTLMTKFDLAAPSLDDALQMVYSTDQPVRKLTFFGDQLEFIACLSEIETMQLFSLAQDECISRLSSTLCDDISSNWMSTRYLVDCVYDAPTHGLLLVSGNYYGDLLASSVSRTGLSPRSSLLEGHLSGARCVFPAADGSILYSGDDSGFICRWNSQIGR